MQHPGRVPVDSVLDAHLLDKALDVERARERDRDQLILRRDAKIQMVLLKGWLVKY